MDNMTVDIVLEQSDHEPKPYINFVPHFKYIGSYISWNICETKYIKERVKSAGNVFSNIKSKLYANNKVMIFL